ncbi:Uncharacterized protein BP5553_00258 [Venustampulla echinocandica]|uniref:Uncharacterized protein n=1 Tax=Venustampulla echinocandica TaxID=2656787 RepID=A0A370TXN3_9HELO|nr:Uncharacterized protein BP5553_00258 [Venustampulla echinocandica]RDL40279.1 Uncharacterized protein BP5553_00258 [Venustampulla echinocandica]
MLPPIDSTILESNPKFAALHATLANTILNPNGSTRNHSGQKERAPSSEALKVSRIRAAKSHILLVALRNLPLSPSTSCSTTSTTKPSTKSQAKQPTRSLPPELVELILLLTSRLSSTPPPSQLKLLEATPQWYSLSTYLPEIGAHVSAHLQTQALSLARIVSPSTNPSFLHRNIPKLTPTITSLQHSISTKKEDLHKQHALLAARTTSLLQTYQIATALTIQLLETSKNGSLSLEKYYLTKMNSLALEMQKIELDAREKALKGEKMVYTPDVANALGRYMENLRDGRERLKDRKRGAERVLWGYGIGRRQEEGGREKERVMREIARVYGELLKEVEEAGRDVKRLKGGR